MLTQQGTQPLSPQLTLLVPREQAAEELDRQLERGAQIREERIRTRDHLDVARQLKKEWVRRNNELFERMFSETTIVEQYAAVTSTILPEFADLELFIDQFYEEMEQRLHRLKTIRRMVESVPEMVRRRIPKPVYSDYDATPPGVVTMDRALSDGSPIPQQVSQQVAPPVPQPARQPAAQPVPQQAVAQPMPQQVQQPVAEPAPQPPQAVPPAVEPVRPMASVQAAALQPAPVQATPVQAASATAPAQGAAAPPAPPSSPKPAARQRTVVVLHGDSESRQAVCDFLQKLDLKAQIFNGGLMECRGELEQLNGQAAFALLLLPQMPDRVLTDDEDMPASAEERGLLLELGYCAGRFGQGRTCALFPGVTGPDSDELGTSYLPMDNAGGWQLALARQIKRAGLDVDLNRIC